MATNSFLKLFLPKDRVFYGLFENVSQRVVEMGRVLKELVVEPDYERRVAIYARIEDLEHENDELTHRIFLELGKNFITPFDREDIHYLASSLDDIADYIFASAKKINFYKVNPIEHDMHRFAELIHQGTVQVDNAVRELRNLKNLRLITDSLVKINSIENQADDLFDLSIERLFDEVSDAKEVIKLREIFQVMEIATDKCEDAGNVIESIIIKYA
jgi:predicted phosphate transport protein (TIGR00153 family)